MEAYIHIKRPAKKIIIKDPKTKKTKCQTHRLNDETMPETKISKKTIEQFKIHPLDEVFADDKKIGIVNDHYVEEF